MSTIAKLSVEIGAKTQQLERSLATASKKIKSFGSSVTTAGMGMTAGLTAPLALLAKSSFEASSQVEETANRFSVSFGEMSGEAEQWAQTTADALNMSATALKDKSSTFKAMFDGMQLDPTIATEMSTTLTELSYDLASFYDKDPSQVFTNLSSAITGETQAVKKYGISLGQSELKAFALENGLISMGEELKGQTKTLAIYQKLMQDSSKAQGDMERTLGSSANVMRATQEQWFEFKAVIGNIIGPVITDALKRINELLKGFQDLSPEVQTNIVKFGALVAVTGPALIILGKMITAVGTVVGVFSGLGGAVAGAVTALGLFTIPVALLTFAGLFDGGLKDKIVDTFNVFTEDFIPDNLFSGLVNDTERTLKKIRALFTGEFEYEFDGYTMKPIVFDDHLEVRENWEDLIGFVQDKVDSMIEYVSGKFAIISNRVSPHLTILKGVFEDTFRTITDALDSDLVQAGIELFDKYIDTLINEFTTGFNIVADIVAFLGTEFQDTFKFIAEIVNYFVKDIMPGILDIVNVIVDEIGYFWAKHGEDVEAFLSIFTTAINTIFEILKELVKIVARNMDRVTTLIGSIANAFLNVVAVIIQLVTGDFSGALQSMEDLFWNLKEGIWTVIEIIADILFGFFGTDLETVRGLVDSALAGIKGVFEAVLGGIGGTVQTLSDKLQGLLETLGIVEKKRKEFADISMTQADAEKAAKSYGQYSEARKKETTTTTPSRSTSFGGYTGSSSMGGITGGLPGGSQSIVIELDGKKIAESTDSSFGDKYIRQGGF